MAFTRNHYFLLFSIILIWAGNIIAIKLAVMELPPLTAAAIRFGLGGILFLPFIKLPGRAQLWTIFQIALLMNVMHLGLLFVGLHMLDAASVSVLLQTQVIFATFLGWLIFKERIRWRTWMGIAVAITGVVIMIGEPDILNNPPAVAVMLVSTLALSFSFVKMKHLQNIHAATYVGLICLIATPFLFAASLLLEPGSWDALPDANWHTLAPVFAYQAIIVSLTHIGWQRLMAIGDVGRISAFSLLIPFIAVLLSVFVLGEHITWHMIVGGLVTMTGVGIITLRRIQKGIA